MLITGATGFLGSNVVRTLLAAGHDVVALVRSTSSLERLAGLGESGHLELVEVDRVAVDTVFEGLPIDAVVHTATHYGRGSRADSTSPRLIEANITFPMAVLTSAIAHGVPLFVNTDSYFNKPGRTYNSLQGYSLTKKYFLDWLQHHDDVIRVVNLRLEHIYGPADSADKFIPTLIEQVGRRQVPSFPMTAGDQVRDFVYVTDVASAYLRVLEGASREPGYDYFEIGTGETASVRDVALLIKSLSGSATQIEFGGLEYRADEIPLSVADSSFADAFGPVSHVSIEQGISALLGRQ